MNQFPVVFLPNDFLNLLRLNLHTTQDTNRIIYSFILERSSFRKFIEESFLDIDPQKRIDYILKSIGWRGLRDRLASLYLGHEAFGNYPKVSNLKFVDDVSQLEDLLTSYTVAGHSRSFILAFYLKLARLKQFQAQGTAWTNTDSESSLLPQSLFEVLPLMGTRVVEIDYIVLGLIHFIDFLGLEKVKGHLNDSSGSFPQLMKLLTDEQRNLLIGNILSYSCSIDEKEIFIPDPTI